MPARTAIAPARRPGRLARFGVFPEHEIKRILLGGIDLDPLAGAQIVQRLAGQLAVTLELAHRVIYVTINSVISQPVGLQLVDQGQHLGHELGGARLMIRTQHAQRIGVVMHEIDEALRQLLDGLAILVGAFDDLVVNVGDIPDIGHIVAGGLEPTVNHVENHHHARVAKVTVVIDRHAADVHADLVGFDGCEYLLFALEGVVDLEHAGMVAPHDSGEGKSMERPGILLE